MVKQRTGTNKRQIETVIQRREIVKQQTNQILMFQYTYWGGHDEVFAAQQPDNNINENCVLIVGQDHYMWHDEVCADVRPYICEVPSGPVTPASTVQGRPDFSS